MLRRVSFVALSVFFALLLSHSAGAQDALQPLPADDPSLITPLPANQEIVEITPGAFTGQNFEDLPWKGSIMFEPERVRRLYTMLNARLPGGRLTDLGGSGQSFGGEDIDISVVDQSELGSGTGAPTAELPPVAPSFYLNSVLFYDPMNWTVWVNHRRIRKNTRLNKLEIASISNDAVEFFWFPSNLDLISPNWISSVKRIESGARKVEPPAALKIQAPLPLALQPTDEIGPIIGPDGSAVDLPPDLPQASDGTALPETVPAPLKDVAALVAAQTSGNGTAVAPTAKPESETPLYVKSGESETLEKPLALPPIFEQEPSNIDVSKLTRMLLDERENIITRNEAAEAIKQAEKEKSLSSGKRETAFSRFDLSGEEIPYLWEYESEDGSILIDTINNVVRFKLGVNQTFVSRTMQVVEGYVKSTAIAAASQETKELPTGTLEDVVFSESQPVAPASRSPARDTLPFSPGQSGAAPPPTPPGSSAEQSGNPASSSSGPPVSSPAFVPGPTPTLPGQQSSPDTEKNQRSLEELLGGNPQ